VARNEISIKAPPSGVFAVLADPHAFSDWVVGAKRIRYYDPSWPQPGSAFHHTVGFGPLAVRDQTKVVEVDEPRRMVLEARAMPAGVAHVSIDIEPEVGGCRVTMIECPIRGPGSRVYNPVVDALVHVRNDVSLRRLQVIAEGRVRGPGEIPTVAAQSAPMNQPPANRA
jgi:uncharacterized protein YndB with AHSA1/START domain